MTYSVRFIVDRKGVPHTINTRIAGCTSELHAKHQITKLYTGVTKIIHANPETPSSSEDE